MVRPGAQSVAQMFRGVRRLENRSCIVIILHEEEESVAVRHLSSTTGVSNGIDVRLTAVPSNAVQVVNMLLSGTDTRQAFPNVIVLATSKLATEVKENFFIQNKPSDQSESVDYTVSLSHSLANFKRSSRKRLVDKGEKGS